MKRIAKAILIGGGIVLTSVHPKPNKCNGSLVATYYKDGKVIHVHDFGEDFVQDNPVPISINKRKPFVADKTIIVIKYK